MTTATATAQKEKTASLVIHPGLMDILMKLAPLPLPKADDLIEGIVLGQERSVLFVDISPVGTGIIYGREYNRAKDIIRALVPGDKITVKIAELENERRLFFPVSEGSQAKNGLEKKRKTCKKPKLL